MLWKQSTTPPTVRCSVLPLNSILLRKATVCLHPFIPICADRLAVGMVINMKKHCFGCMAEYEAQSNSCPYCGYSYNTQTESPLHMRPGTILKERYTIGRVIGYGGFGITYIAWDNLLEQRIAIKEYLPSEFATRSMGQSNITVFGGNKSVQFSDGMTKFIDEAKRLAQFQNEPGIVRVYDSFETNNTAYIIMEYLEGETLTEYLNREGNISVDDAVKMLAPVIASLEAVHHAGIIHRDIAPDNIMLTKDGQTKLIDFGAARHATTSHSRSLTVIIKPGYSAEEQYRSRGDQGPHTDVYALGAVMYRMITGVVPPDALERRALLEGKKKDSLLPPSRYCKISKSIENAILNAMNVRVDKRTSTAKLFLDQLTANTKIRLVKGKIQHIDLMRWPLWAKIVVPALGVTVTALLVLLFTGKIGFENHLITTLTLGKNMTRVPSVINYSVSSAQEALSGANLVAIINGREVSTTIPVDMVLRQSINAGEIIEQNTAVALYISAATELEIKEGVMPDVTYYTESEATEMLRTQGLMVSAEREYNDKVAEGIVIRTSKNKGEKINEGDAITLYISLGVDPSSAENNIDDVPDDIPTTADKPASIPAVELNHKTLNLNTGSNGQLKASGGNGSYSWSSSNPSVAVVDNGKVSALSDGTAVISVTSGNKVDSCNVIVRTVWSDWMDNYPSGVSTSVETRTIYRYRNNSYETTISQSSSLGGWTQYDYDITYGSWSDWYDSEITPTVKTDVETQRVQATAGHTEYRYGRWRNSRGVVNYCAEYSERNGGTCTVEYDSWSETPRTYQAVDWTCGCSDSQHPRHTNVHHYTDDGRAWWQEYAGNWFWEETRWVEATYKTQYRSRPIIVTYSYYRWAKGDWSSWSETAYSPDGEAREVESKVQYRYIVP